MDEENNDGREQSQENNNTHHHKNQYLPPGHMNGSNVNYTPFCNLIERKLAQENCCNRSQQEVSRAHPRARKGNKKTSENTVDIRDELILKVTDG
jgi:hypothetical protein